MKTKEELEQIKEEYSELTKKLAVKIQSDTELRKQFVDAVKGNKIPKFFKDCGIETTKEELNALTDYCKDLRNKLLELNENELTQVSGGQHGSWICPFCGGRFGTIDEILIHSTYCSLARH